MSEGPIRPVNRSTLVESVTDLLRRQILSGVMAAGSRLPSERELALRLGVNRLSLRAALARLESQGLVSTQHGTGTVVRDWRDHGGVETLPKLVRLARERGVDEYIKLVGELLELRRTIAAEGVALAALRRTQDDLDMMRSLAQVQTTRLHDIEAFARGDIEFARLVVRAARNTGLHLCFNTLARFQYEETELVLLMYPQPALQCTHYDGVIELIEKGDPEHARNVMRTALDAFDKMTMEMLSHSGAASSAVSSQEAKQ